MREALTTDEAPTSSLFSQAIRAGKHIFISGLVGVDATAGKPAGPTIQEQTGQAIRNCEALLHAAGATLDDVVEVGVLLADPADFPGMNEEYARWFAEPPPARCAARLGADIPASSSRSGWPRSRASYRDRARPRGKRTRYVVAQREESLRRFFQPGRLCQMGEQDLTGGFEISESFEPGGVRVSVAGELDVAVIEQLQQRLDSLARTGEAVVLDLSELAFIDSSGLNVIVTSLRQAQLEGWELRIDQSLTPTVLRVVKLMGLDAVFWG